MKAILLAAGFSTRLYPLTEYFPKGLLEVGGKSISGYVMDELVKLPEVDEIVLVTNHRYVEHFINWVKNEYKNYSIQIIDDCATHKDERLGAIGDLQLVIEQKGWQNEDILVLSSDTLSSLKLSEFVDFFESHHGVINAVYDTKDKEIIREKLGCVTLDQDKIVQFIEKPSEPEGTLTSIPYYIFPKEASALVTQYLSEGNSADAPGSIISWLIDKLPVYGFQTKGYYYDVGTKEVYERLKVDFSSLIK